MPRLAPRILVHAHVFYQNMWAELAQKIQNINGCDVDLHITTTQENDRFNSLVLEQYPNATITLVENRGFDVLPFIQLIKNINKDAYDYVVKVHTKRDTLKCKLGGHILQGPDWRNASLSFLESPQIVSSNLKHFEDNPDCGIIASHLLTVKITKNSTKLTKKRFAQLLQDYKQRPIAQAKFVAGTMFMARANALKPLRYIPTDAFEDYVEHDDLFAHIVERFMGHIIYEQGMSIQDPNKENDISFAEGLSRAWKTKIAPFIFQTGITNKDRLFIKIFKIPLPYSFNEKMFPSFKKRLLKEKNNLIESVNRANQIPTDLNP